MKFKHLLKTTALTLLLVIAGKVGWGQAYTFTAGNLVYTQDFDGMTATGLTYLTGWTSIRYSGSGTANATLVMAVTDGATTSGNIYNVGTTSAADRCFGSLGSGSTVPAYGASLTNNAGITISDLLFSFTIEQWRSGSSNTANEKNIFQYSVDATSLSTGTWIAVSTLDLNEILTTTTTAVKVDGNLPANQASVSASVSGLSLANGATIWFRWVDDDVAGSDGILTIDNLSITASSDTQAPTLSSVSPVDNTIDVAITSNLSITLNENIAKGTGSILIKKVSDDATELSIDIASSNVAISGKTATITLSSFLKEGIEYYVIVPNGCITDMAGNAFAGITVKGDWSFTTLATVTPIVRIDYPNGGEKLYAGDAVNFKWTSANMDAENVKIEVWVYNNGTSTWGWTEAIATTTNDGIEPFTIPADAWYGTAYKARITSLTTSTIDESDANFTIIATPTINTIQSTRTDGDKSDYNGTIVRFTGIVTAKKSSGSGYFVQSGAGVNNGIYVFGPVAAAAVGDNVTIEGSIAEYQSGTPLFLTEMVPTSVSVNSSGNSLPNATVITTGQFLTTNVTSEPYEGVLIKMVNASVASSTTIDDGSGVVTLGSDLSSFTLPAIGSKVTITGLGFYSTTLGYKLLPRSAADIQSSDASITSTTYTIDQGTGVISNVPYTVDVTTFKSKLTKATGSTYDVFDADGTTPATVINDTKKVIVTSEDGLFTKTYTITRNAASTDATLSNLTSDGTQVPSFLPATLTYNIAFPYGTLATAIPTVVATVLDANAIANITYATDLAGDAAARTTTITVTAEDASTVLVYTIVYSITPANTDNTLSEIRVDGNPIVEFVSSTTAYFVELPVGTTTVPTVTAATTHITANADITPAVNVTGTPIERTTTIVVTAQDLSTKTYTVEFSVALPGTDATLSDLKIDGVTVTGFAALTTTYNVGLDAGTTVVPTVTAVTNDVLATKEITPATNLAGTLAERTTTIVATAQNTTTSKTYTVVFFVKSDDATLSNLTYDGIQVPSFNAATVTYNVELPHNTTVVPTVVGTKNNANATVNVTPATDIAGDAAARTTTILVTAEDDSYTKTYTIVFSVAKDTDANLTSITYDGTALAGFASGTLNYFVTFSFGTTVVPVVAFTKSDVNANAVIVQAANLTGTLAERTATITVTAEDGIASKVYTIVFRVDNVLKELFISEYIEGNSNNRAFEIYNPKSTPVDLNGYTIKCSYNGTGFGKRDGVDDSRYILTFAPNTMIAAGDVYVVYNNQAVEGIASVGDLSLTYSATANVGNGSNITSFTGNDALGLYKGAALIDVFGGELETTDFSVAGTAAGSVNHTIVRKPSVHTGNTNWATNLGTTPENSEWIVYDIDVFSYIGSHNSDPTDPAIITNATTLSDFGSIVQGTVGLVEGTFNVSGSLLTDNIIVTAPTGFEISKLSGTNFVSEGPITLTPASGTVAVTPIYVRFHPLAAQAYSGNITITSVGIPDKAVAVSGTGIATDDTPPAFIVGYPASANIEPYKFDVTFKTDEAGKVYIVKQTSGTAAPTNTEVFTDPAAIIVSVAANTEYSSTFTGLTMNTAYDMYLVAGDNQSTTNISDVVKLTVTTLNIPAVTIHDIQYTTDASGDSPYKDQWVSTTGIVTAIKGTTSFWIQNGTGAWNGMYVYSSTVVSLGDNVTVTGKVAESFKVTQFTSSAVVTINNSGNIVPDAVEVTTLAANSEMYEGVFVKVKRATCASGSAGSYVVNDGSGNLTVYKGIYAGLTLTLTNNYDISGVIDYYNTGSIYEIYPRSTADISDVTGINDNNTLNVKVFPNPFSHEIRFEGVDNIKRVIITNITGQVLKNVEIGQVNFVNTQDLPRGMYLVTFMNSKGEKTTQKMVKQ